MRTLYGLNQSPWTERARWALDHHGVSYTYHEHVPLLGEVFLRRKARVKKPSVPLLVDGADAVMGSFAIARHAERIGRAALLIPREREPEVSRWNDLAERMTEVGRVWVLPRLRASREAQREALPSFVPSVLRGAFAPTTGMVIGFLARKHAVATDARRAIEDVLRPALVEIRAALDGKTYLTGVFTYADVAIAAALGAVRPHERIAIGPATRAAWTNEALAADFDDLLMWRDAVYRKHR